jgi:hypothetical protein
MLQFGKENSAYLQLHYSDELLLQYLQKPQALVVLGLINKQTSLVRFPDLLKLVLLLLLLMFCDCAFFTSEILIFCPPPHPPDNL